MAGVGAPHSCFARIAYRASQAGHCGVNTLDHNGIIGPHDEIPNLVFATGFSGHGVMHSPTTGRGVAEWIMTEEFETIGLSDLGYARIRAGRPLREMVVY
jgi:FAD-dependent oxidoreductase domain-containing protein 1